MHKLTAGLADRSPSSKTESRCLLIKVDKLQLIVPQILVAEVIDLEGIVLSSTLNKHIKIFLWRGFQVPMISANLFRADCTENFSAGHKVIIFHGVLNHRRLPFYAFIASQNPRLLTVSEDQIAEHRETPSGKSTSEKTASADSLSLLLSLDVEGTEAAIPRVDHIEKFIHNNLFS